MPKWLLLLTHVQPGSCYPHMQLNVFLDSTAFIRSYLTLSPPHLNKNFKHQDYMGGTGCVDSCAPQISLLGHDPKEFYVCKCQLLSGRGKVVERDFGSELRDLIAGKRLPCRLVHCSRTCSYCEEVTFCSSPQLHRQLFAPQIDDLMAILLIQKRAAWHFVTMWIPPVSMQQIIRVGVI